MTIFAPGMKDRKLLNIELGRLSAEQYRSEREPSGIVIVREEGYAVLSVEQTVHSLKLGKDFHRESGRKLALIFGNEVDGVRQDVVDASDAALEIPQSGTKHSLNVSVAVGVVLWEIVR